MGQQETKPSIFFVALSFIVSSLHAQAYTRPESLPKAEAEFGVYRLFQIQSGAFQFASVANFGNATRSPNDFSSDFARRELQIRFRKQLQWQQDLPLHLGTSCTLRSMNSIQKTGNLVHSSLPLASEQTLAEGSEYTVQNIRMEAQRIRADLSITRKSPPRFELRCEHPQLQQWTVNSFEMHTGGVFEIRTNIQRDPANLAHHYGPERSQTLSELVGSRWNGWFGSGLPQTSGVQLLIGAQLAAFASNQNRALWIGKKCAVLNLNSISDSGSYKKDSKYAYTGTQVDTELNRIRFYFENRGYELSGLTIECQGSAEQILSWNTRDLETDLNQILHFYQK